jgi:hypothetical protein
MPKLEVTLDFFSGEVKEKGWTLSRVFPDTIDFPELEKVIVDAISTAVDEILKKEREPAITDKKLEFWTHNLSQNQKVFLKQLCTQLEVTISEALQAIGRPNARGSVMAGITANLHRRANKYKMPLPYTKFKKEIQPGQLEHAWKIEKEIAEKILPFL